MTIDHVGNITKEAGPVIMTFTIPMYNASRLQVKICSLLIVKIIHGHLVSWVGLGTVMSLMIVIGFHIYFHFHFHVQFIRNG